MDGSNILPATNYAATPRYPVDDFPLDPDDPAADGAVFAPFRQEISRAIDKAATGLQRDLLAMEHMIFEKMMQWAVPDAYAGPTPAHLLLHARPKSATGELLPETQFSLPGANGKIYHFSAFRPFRAIAGDVKAIACSGFLFPVENGFQKEEHPLRAGFLKNLPQHQIFIGLDLLENPGILSELCFYFHWADKTHLNRNIALLQVADWYFDGQRLSSRAGLRYSVTGEENEVAFAEINLHARRIENFYSSCFMTVSGLTGLTKGFPEAMRHVFAEEETRAFRLEYLYWLQLVFPKETPEETLTGLCCALNCFPMANKTLHSELLSREIIATTPLPCHGEHFLSIKQVSGQKIYPSPDWRNADKTPADQWSVQLNSGKPFIHFRKPPEEVDVSVKYWTSAGEAANGISPATPVQPPDADWERSSLGLLQASQGGRDAPTSLEKWNILKSTLRSRERLVTPQDFRAFIHAQLTLPLERVEICNNIGRKPGGALYRLIEVNIYPKPGTVLSTSYQSEQTLWLQQEIQSRTTGIFPIQVFFK